MESREQIIKRIESAEEPILSYIFSNYEGRIFAMTENTKNTTKNFGNGLSVDGSSVPGFTQTNESDILLHGEPETFKELDIAGRVYPSVMCHATMPNGTRCDGDPRAILQRVLAEYEEMGLEPLTMSELEFFYVRKDKEGAIRTMDSARYLEMPPFSKCDGYLRDLATCLKKNDIDFRRIHSECGPGQNEIELVLKPALENCDNTVLVQWIIDMLAAAEPETDMGALEVMFGPKPFDKLAGNGLHQHIRIMDKKTGLNLLAPEEENTTTISTWGRKFVAGMIKYAPEITATFVSEESYKRLGAMESPCHAIWGYSNRNAYVRVPPISVNDPQGAKVEMRAGDLSGSPHLLNAVMLAAGLRGIKEDLEPVPHTIPGNLDIATGGVCPDAIMQMHREAGEPVKVTEEDNEKYRLVALPMWEKSREILKSDSEFLAEVLGGMQSMLLKRGHSTAHGPSTGYIPPQGRNNNRRRNNRNRNRNRKAELKEEVVAPQE